MKYTHFVAFVIHFEFGAHIACVFAKYLLNRILIAPCYRQFVACLLCIIVIAEYLI